MTWGLAEAESSAVVADLSDQKMWRIDRTADYGAFQDAARGRVDLARIERHWEDILRRFIVHAGGGKRLPAEPRRDRPGALH
ncbi:Tn3 transposase DDE domain protein [Streptomyces malaysiensis subsp. malaysiensis]|nr:Tn3 transposase DDE domain protein [Streptomyces sp. M56]